MSEYGSGNVWWCKSESRFIGTYGSGKGRLRIRGRKNESKRDVRRRLTQAIVEGKQMARGGETLGQWLDAWLLEREPSVRIQTLRSYERLAAHPYRVLGTMRLHELQEEHIHQLLNALRIEGKAPGTVRGVFLLLRHALTDAKRRRKLRDHPCDGIETPRVPASEPTLLTPKQVKLLLLKTRDTRWHALWAVIAVYGLRIGEALALQWEDIEPEYIQVRATMTNPGTRDERTRGAPKSEASRRTLLLLPEVAEALKAHKVLQDKQRLQTLGWHDQGLVFPDTHGGLQSASWPRDSLARTCSRIGIPIVTPHALRHGAGTYLASLGINPATAQRILGHSDVSITLRLYTHPTDEMREDAVRQMGKLLVEGA